MAKEGISKEKLDEKEEQQIKERDEENDADKSQVHQSSRGQLNLNRNLIADEDHQATSAKRSELLLTEQSGPEMTPRGWC